MKEEIFAILACTAIFMIWKSWRNIQMKVVLKQHLADVLSYTRWKSKDKVRSELVLNGLQLSQAEFDRLMIDLKSESYINCRDGEEPVSVDTPDDCFTSKDNRTRFDTDTRRRPRVTLYRLSI